MNKHLAIITYSASGSNAVFDHLLNNKHVYKHKNKEILNVRSSTQGKLNKKSLAHGHWYRHHIAEFVNEAERAGQKLLVHIKPPHLDVLDLTLAEVIETMSEDFNLIHIKRSNYLAMYFSMAVKLHRKEEHILLDTDMDFIPKRKLVMPVKNLLDKLDALDAQHNEIADLIADKDSISISYEDDINVDLRSTVDKIANCFDFYDNFEYTPQRMRYATTKNKWSDIPLRDKIENFTELSEILAGTKYEWMLHE